jgi:hypothetical protein
MPGIEQRFLKSQARSLVTIPTELFRLTIARTFIATHLANKISFMVRLQRKDFHNRSGLLRTSNCILLRVLKELLLSIDFTVSSNYHQQHYADSRRNGSKKQIRVDMEADSHSY